MKYIVLIIVCVISFFTFIEKNCFSTVYNSTSSIVEEKMRLEKDIEKRLQGVLDNIVGPGKSTVVVNIELKIEKSEVQREKWMGKPSQKKKELFSGLRSVNDEDFYLPGIPLKKPPVPQKSSQKITQDVEKSIEFIETISPSFIKKLSVVLILDKSISDEVVDTIKNDIPKMIGLNVKRGDNLTIRKISFVKSSFWLFLKKPLTYKLLVVLLITGIVMGITGAFLFGPLKNFFTNFLETLKLVKTTAEETVEEKQEIKNATPGEMSIPPPMIGGGIGGSGLGGMTVAALNSGTDILKKEEEKKTEEEKPRPFSFMREDKVRHLAYMIKDEPIEIIAAVIDYLNPDMAAEVISLLPSSVQIEVAQALTTIRQMTPAEITKLEKEIKNKIDFVVGGVNNFVQILNQTPKKVRESILTTLSKIDSKLSDKIRESIFTFESIAQMPDLSVQLVLSEVDTPTLSIALKSASEGVKSKIIKNMSEGAAALLKEEMEFGKPVTAKRVEEIQRQILEVIHRLEREGKIILRVEDQRKEEELEEYIRSLEQGKVKVVKKTSSLMQQKAKLNEKEEADTHKLTEESQDEVDRKKAEEHYNAGIKAYQEKRYEDAILEFTESIKYNNSIWQTFQYLGSAYYARGMGKEAICAYKKTLELNPGNNQLREWLASYERENSQVKTES